MSDKLSRRSITKPIRRNNAKRAIERIMAELNVLIRNAKDADEIDQKVVASQCRVAVYRVANLYAIKIDAGKLP